MTERTLLIIIIVIAILVMVGVIAGIAYLAKREADKLKKEFKNGK